MPADRRATPDTRPRIAGLLQLLEQTLQPQRRLLHAGEAAYRAGQAFTHLFVLNSGCVKLVGASADGRDQLIGLRVRGDWLGFSAIARGCYGCDALAMDTGELWAIRYEALLKACATDPALLAAVHGAMSDELVRDRDARMSVCMLPADARVADFLCNWAGSLAERGLRSDPLTLPLSRAEIGAALGITLETVSRALSRLAREELIRFPARGRRHISIPDVDGLAAFIQRSVAAPATALQ